MSAHKKIKSSRNNDIDVEKAFNGNELFILSKPKKTQIVKTFRDRNLTTWVDKYRPKHLKDIIGHDDIKDMLISSIEKGDLPHLLFHGGSGTGKTSTVTALVMQLYGPDKINNKVLELNASDENGINVVREKIIRFANIVVGSPDPKYPSPSFKIIILDEADSMTSEAQTALKKVMESTCEITRFVFICNYENKIIDAIKSRCASFRFNSIPNNLMIEKLKLIANKEHINIDDDVFTEITTICCGDARRSINTLQNIKYIPNSSNRKITKQDIYDMTSYIDNKYFDKYWDNILSYTIAELNELVIELINTGFPLDYLLLRIKDKVIATKMSDKQIAKIIVYIGKVERMITCGSDNYIQLFAVLAYINGIYKKMNVDDPQIF
jgi:replication factor C subunit 2/4